MKTITINLDKKKSYYKRRTNRYALVNQKRNNVRHKEDVSDSIDTNHILGEFFNQNNLKFNQCEYTSNQLYQFSIGLPSNNFKFKVFNKTHKEDNYSKNVVMELKKIMNAEIDIIICSKKYNNVEDINKNIVKNGDFKITIVRENKIEYYYEILYFIPIDEFMKKSKAISNKFQSGDIMIDYKYMKPISELENYISKKENYTKCKNTNNYIREIVSKRFENFYIRLDESKYGRSKTKCFYKAYNIDGKDKLIKEVNTLISLKFRYGILSDFSNEFKNKNLYFGVSKIIINDNCNTLKDY